jgi:hypothetical protein
MVPNLAAVTPDQIMQLGFTYWGSKTLLSAVELGLFTELAKGPLDAETLRRRLGLHPRGARDFFDALVALSMLERRGDEYLNTPAGNLFLDRATASYSGGFLEMSGGRLYGFWDSLTEALRTGQPQNEAETGGDFFTALYQDPSRLKGFAHAMTGISMGAAQAIARQFPWSRYRTFADVGTAEGCLPVQVALAHPHLGGVGFDLPPLGPIFDEYVGSFGLDGRLRFQGGRLPDRAAARRGCARHGARPARLERGRAAHAARQGLHGATGRRGAGGVRDDHRRRAA